MKVKDLKIGQYFTLKKGEEARITDYYPPYYRDDELNYLFTPVRFKRANEDDYKWYMVDTYKMPKIYNDEYNTTEEFLEILESLQDVAFRAPSWSDYSFRIEIDDEFLSLFNLAFDLRDYEFITEEEASGYNDEDIFTSLKLFNINNHTMLKNIVRKGAEKDTSMVILQDIEAIRVALTLPFIDNDTKEYLEKLKDDSSENSEIYKEMKDLVSIIEDGQKKVNQFIETSKYFIILGKNIYCDTDKLSKNIKG